MKIRCLSFLTLLLLLASQAQADSPLPALHSLSVQQDKIIFEVTSHGCSKDADFKLRVEDGPRITLLRTRPDFCKRMPVVFRVERSRSDTGLSLQTPFTVSNPFMPPPSKSKARSVKSPTKGKSLSK